jgi:hypothetical protein
VISPRSNHEVEQQLAEWARIDDEAGYLAAKRRIAALEASGLEVRDYEFHVKPNDWVHRDWLRPVRFVYRNIPKGIRMELKKRLVK